MYVAMSRLGFSNMKSSMFDKVFRDKQALGQSNNLHWALNMGFKLMNPRSNTCYLKHCTDSAKVGASSKF